MTIALSDTELWEMLANAHTGILTTLRRDGSPSSVPLWFVVLDRAVYLRTQAGSAKVGHIRRDSRVCFLVESGKAWAELTAALLHANAVLVPDQETTSRVDAGFDEKYAAFRMPGASVPDATKAHYAQARAYIRLDPRGRPISWGTAKLLSSRP